MRRGISGKLGLHLFVLATILAIGSSCRFLMPKKDMFDPANLSNAISAFSEKYGPEAMLKGIEVLPTEAVFYSGSDAFSYNRGTFSRTSSGRAPSGKPFQASEVNVDNLDAGRVNVANRAARNRYMTSPELTKITITKQTVDRDDNLISGIGRRRDAMQIKFAIQSDKTTNEYSTNLDGEIVDIPATNTAPRINFVDPKEVERAMSMIVPIFGGTVRAVEFSVMQAYISFTAIDPNNPDDLNGYRWDHHEFLRAGVSQAKSTTAWNNEQDRHRESFKGYAPHLIQIDTIFDLAKTDLSALSSVITTAQERSGSDKPAIRSISMRRVEDLDGSNPRFVWRASTVAERGETTDLVFDENGKLLDRKREGDR